MSNSKTPWLIHGGQSAEQLIEVSEIVAGEEGGVLTAWCWWSVPGTELQGGGLIKVGDDGVLSERVTYYEGFACVKRELPNIKIRNAKDAKIMAELTVALAEAATIMKERGLAGAVPLLEGPYTAAQLANGGNDPIAKALEGLFLEPPDGA